MRALCFDWPSDARIWDYPYEYLLGDDLLVAPVTASAAETADATKATEVAVADPRSVAWPVYLPSGDWVDAWTGQRVVGPAEFARAVPLDEIPVYIRAEAWDRLGPVFRDDEPVPA